MCERNKKLTLEQIRTLYHFDIPTLAAQAGVSTRTVYHTLLQKPAYKVDADKILAALSQYIGLQLSFDQVDIVTWEDYLFLWIVRASSEEPQVKESQLLDEFNFVYARDQKHATALAHAWLEHRPHLPHHYFTPCPEGLMIGDISIPGHVKADQ
ncbi:hypothetical protein ccbrp13_46450 [Ktedonobacteria bacterium brp13]|nr:hypothetical protein ccbrp13_46450 [Ktedonobacteria bacterium brp13]